MEVFGDQAKNWKWVISECWSILTAMFGIRGFNSGSPLARDRLIRSVVPMSPVRIASHMLRCVDE